MCLLIGSPAVGKTMLLKRLHSFSNFNDVGEAPATIPTVGTNLVSVTGGRRGEITVREIGGCMAPVWKDYYNDCSALLLMLDVSNKSQVSSSCIQLCEVLTNPALQQVPVLIMLNKIDIDTGMKRVEFDSLVFLDSLVKNCQQKVTVLETSAKTGRGLQAVSKWIQDNVKAS